MSKPKLILINGFAGSGKSTIAQRYILEHPLALAVEGDELIVKLGRWLEYESIARDLVYEMIKKLVSAHLAQGYDVVVPYLVTDASHVAAFREIAQKNNAHFFNFLLFNEKSVAISHLLERGTWGEEGTDPLSEKDLPVIESLFNQMETQLEIQTDVIIIKQSHLGVEDTYSQMSKTISTASE